MAALSFCRAALLVLALILAFAVVLTVAPTMALTGTAVVLFVVARAWVAPSVTAPAEAVKVRTRPPMERRKRPDEHEFRRVVDRISPWDFL
ncbi:hypothetical protein GCM10010156_12540 [Planobispora rosea]|uniref:Uncharacterized protein n=1 Tax=Planobispora rosea TaxID=35762 RepID=A0A8J3RYD0_PLARO|nr:hypothetical protein GCM10010156_12540 [Planobispora rosea]GIH82855.1 hypothetical protein Pro02_12630 [Planobispora rosea]